MPNLHQNQRLQILSRICLEKRLPSNLVQTRWRGQLSTQQGASTPFISDSLLRKLSASLLLSLTLTAQKTFIFHSFIYSPTLYILHCDPWFTKRSQHVRMALITARTHKNNLLSVMDLHMQRQCQQSSDGAGEREILQ